MLLFPRMRTQSRHIIDKHGLYKTQKKIEAVLNTTEPKTVTEVRAFLCLVHYYQTFLPNNSTVVHPLHKSFKKTVQMELES